MNLLDAGKKIDDIQVKISYKIIELFSAGLYSSPNKAFEELVCNSYDAFATNVSVYVAPDLSANDAYIWVCDNGEGLNAQELKDLWRIGESSKRDDLNRDQKRLQIGQFGIGKLATYILARKLTYISKKNDRYILATMDYDLIQNNKEKESLVIDEREISEKEAEQLLSLYLKGKSSFELFGKKAVQTWTISILTDLKPKAAEISEGRLKWILRTALPLNPNFKLFYNGVLIESSKVKVPIMKEWVFGKEDKTANELDFAQCREENEQYFVDFENLKGVKGTITLYTDSLVDGKSSSLGRSHGIFLSIRGRLINLDDPLLGMEAFSHGVFNRTRIVVDADELDNNLTSTREAVKESLPFKQLKEYIKKKFNNEVRKFYFEQEQKASEKKTVSYRLAQTSYTTSKRPIYNFIKNYYDSEIVNPFLIEKPTIDEKDILIRAYENDLETGEQVIEEIKWDILGSEEPIAKLNLKSRTLTINELHPYIANYNDAYTSNIPLESMAITEVLTEAHLYEIGIPEETVNEIMKKRDITLRQLALADRVGIPAVAMLVKDSLANPTGLEEAVYRALSALGFETSRIGGNGEPDGKANAILGYDENSKSKNYSLTFDAKSTKTKAIAAGTAHLSALKRHQKKYNAEYCIEVAIGYQGEDDPESAISVEARMQKVTIITAKDLVKLLFLATPKQIGLDKLRSLFDTCYSPLEVHDWIEKIEKAEVYKPPYYDIIDVIYELQKEDNEPPTIRVVRKELNRKLNEKYLTPQVIEWVKVLCALVPGCVTIENEFVGVQATPESIKSRIAKAIHSTVPDEMQKVYKEIFKG
ncbi:MAG: ATP-binding protein [Lachnospiraceae bacterium]|nr:ATP-binding protein [Lachnospiraceae bacterium]